MPVRPARFGRLATAAAVAAVVIGGAAPTVVAAAAAVPRPVLTAVSRHHVDTAGGQEITLRGRNLASTTSVYLGRARTTLEIATPTHVVVMTPRHPSGTYPLTLHVKGGATPAQRPQIVVAPAPQVIRIDHRVLPTTGGTTVAVSGNYFTRVTEVWFGTVRATSFHVSNTRALTAVAPKHVVGESSISVESWYGTSGYGPVRFGVPLTATSTLRSIDPLRRVPTDVSCASSTFCMMVDGSGFAFAGDGAQWQETEPTGSQALNHVYCYAAALCFAWSGSNVIRYDGAHWSTAAGAFGGHVDAMTCWSADGCRAFSDDVEYVWDGAAWTQGVTLSQQPQQPPILAVTCSSRTSCEAVDSGGSAWSLAGTTWTANELSGLSDEAVDASCAPDGSCLAVGGSRLTDVEQWNGAQWHHLLAMPAVGVQYLSCASASSCVGTNADRQLVSFDGSAWTRGPDLPSAMNRQPVFSCGGDECRFFDSHGSSQSFDGASFGDPVAVDPPAGQLRSVSCATATSCIAADEYENVLTRSSADGTWSRPDHVGVVSVSCSAEDHCAGTDFAGRLSERRGTSWSPPTQVLPSGAGQPPAVPIISCAGATFCAAASGTKVAVLGDTGDWTTTTVAATPIVGLSCWASDACAVITQQGHVARLSNAGWHRGETVFVETTAFACTAAACFVGGDDGSVARTTARSTELTQAVLEGPVTTMACATSSSCVAVNDEPSFTDRRQFAVYGGRSWSAPGALAFHITSVTCPVERTCLVSSDDDLIARIHW